MKVRSPETETEFAAYFELRWKVLREPWGKPRGSERDELDTAACHVAGFDEAKSIVCVGRLHVVRPGAGQVRYMAVVESLRGRGLGQAVLDELEHLAWQLGMTTVFLDARESAVGFYLRNGYAIVGDGHTLFGEVHHSKMRKQLIGKS